MTERGSEPGLACCLTCSACCAKASDMRWILEFRHAVEAEGEPPRSAQSHFGADPFGKFQAMLHRLFGKGSSHRLQSEYFGTSLPPYLCKTPAIAPGIRRVGAGGLSNGASPAAAGDIDQSSSTVDPRTSKKLPPPHLRSSAREASMAAVRPRKQKPAHVCSGSFSTDPVSAKADQCRLLLQ